jgi:hypothetical protein
MTCKTCDGNRPVVIETHGNGDVDEWPCPDCSVPSYKAELDGESGKCATCGGSGRNYRYFDAKHVSKETRPAWCPLPVKVEVEKEK